MKGTAGELPRIWHCGPSKELLTNLDFAKQNLKDTSGGHQGFGENSCPLLPSSFRKRHNGVHMCSLKGTVADYRTQRTHLTKCSQSLCFSSCRRRPVETVS